MDTTAFSDCFFGISDSMQAIRRSVQAIAHSRLPLVIRGEIGTGKEFFAQFVHKNAGVYSGHMIKVSCFALSDTALASEIFGDRSASLLGSLAAADGGTLLLDGIEFAGPETQAKILQYLADGTYCPVGDRARERSSARIICTMKDDSRRSASPNEFDGELFYRLSALNVTLPPLRDHAADIPDLVKYYLEDTSASMATSVPQLSQDVIQLMKSHRWPGNLRQMENMIRGYVLLGHEEELLRELMSDPWDRKDPLTGEVDLTKPIALKAISRHAAHHVEKQIILRVLQAHGWNRQQTAKWLKISYRSLLYKLSEWKITPQSSETV